MWRYALVTTAQEHPLIGLGAGRPIETGLGPTVSINRKSGAHNSLVGYAFYSGYPSAILVALVFIIALVSCWRFRAFPGCASLFGATTAVAVTCMTNVALETPFIAGPAWAVLGAALGAAAAAHGEVRGTGLYPATGGRRSTPHVRQHGGTGPGSVVPSSPS
jgi:hypothetical protein